MSPITFSGTLSSSYGAGNTPGRCSGFSAITFAFSLGWCTTSSYVSCTMTRKMFTTRKMDRQHQKYINTWPEKPADQYTPSKMLTRLSPLLTQNRVAKDCVGFAKSKVFQ